MFRLYLLLFSLVAFVLMPICIAGCDRSEKVEVISTSLPLDGDYDESIAPIDFGSDATFSEATEAESLESEIEVCLTELGEYFSRALKGISPDTPEFVSPAFYGVGIDRQRFDVRFNGDRIAIGRWQTADTAPKFADDSALSQFFQNVLIGWKQSEQFGIDFRIYNIDPSESSIKANVVAETFGQTKSDTGLQATSLWATEWTRDAAQGLVLKSIKVLGREELIVRVKQGQLLQDCTESIFSKCDAWETQLKFGLDQWARQIPGLNVIGNQGIAIADINQDGLDDLYVCEGHGLANLMLLQNPDGTVRNIAADGGVDLLDETRAALIIDIDNDGDQDLALSTDECVVLYSNDGNEKFQLEKKLRIGYDGSSLSAADFDLDGDLDIFVCKFKKIRDQTDFLTVPDSYSKSESGGRNVLLRNDEGWIFKDVTEEVGLTENNRAHSRSAIWIDFDSDGDQDLYVANEWSSSRLYANQNGWFSDVTSKKGMEFGAQARSVSAGDFNRDARPDLFVANDASSRQYRVIKSRLNEKAIDDETGKALIAQSQVWFSRDDTENAFKRYPLPTPIFSTESSFGSAVTDLNNDGLDDILVANGYLSRTSSEDLQAFWARCIAEGVSVGESNTNSINSRAHEIGDLIRGGFSISGNQRNRCYLNMGPIGFANFSGGSGIDMLHDARAIATSDWDNDGDTDVVMVSRNGPRIRILCNQIESENESINVSLVGTESNSDAIGARVEVWLEGQLVPVVRWVTAGSGYLAQSSRNIQIGLGKGVTVSKVDIVWPGGKRQSFDRLLTNRFYTLTENRVEAAERTAKRFDLQTKPSWLDGNLDRPPVSRSLFYPSSVLPSISIKSDDSRWYRIESQSKEALLVMFHDGSDSSEGMLRDFAKNSSELNLAGIGCVAAFCNRAEPDSSLNDQSMQLTELCDSVSWPYPSGVVPEKAIGKLRLACGEWFSSQHLPELPFGILLDRTGAVKAFYPAERLGSRQLLRDKSICGPGFGNDWQALTGRSGTWLNTNRVADMTRLKDRFLELGLNKEALDLNRRTAPATARLLAMKGVELAALNDFDMAGVFFERAIAVDTSCKLAHIERGELLRKMAALQLSEDPKRTDLLNEAVKSFEFALRIDANDVDAVIGYSNANIDQMLVDAAIEKLKEYLASHPETPEIHAVLGRLQFSKKQYVDAATHLTIAFDKHPTLPYVAGDLGFLYLSSGEASRAKKFLRLANRLQPSDRNVLKFLAEAEFATAQYEDSIRLFERYLKDSPKHLRSNCILAWIYATCPYEGLRNADRGLELISPMLKLYKDSSFICEITAACYADKGEFDKAVSMQQKALDMVRDKATTDQYTESQIDGMQKRMDLFGNRLPYRSDELSQIPIKRVGKRNQR